MYFLKLKETSWFVFMWLYCVCMNAFIFGGLITRAHAGANGYPYEDIFFFFFFKLVNVELCAECSVFHGLPWVEHTVQPWKQSSLVINYTKAAVIIIVNWIKRSLKRVRAANKLAWELAECGNFPAEINLQLGHLGFCSQSCWLSKAHISGSCEELENKWQEENTQVDLTFNYVFSRKACL